MATYLKKSMMVEAFQMSEEMRHLMLSANDNSFPDWLIKSLMDSVGDNNWIINPRIGDIYICSPERFASDYEKVESE